MTAEQVFAAVACGAMTFEEFEVWLEARDERKQEQADWAARDAAGH